MKKILLYLWLTLVLAGCFSNDDYVYSERPTDFSKDISNKTDFYLSTQVALDVLNLTTKKDTLIYNVNDTIKLNLSLDAFYKDNATDTYDLIKSTGADYYSFQIYTGAEVDQKIVNLTRLKQFPELLSNTLSTQDILTNPLYKNLYFNNSIRANYNKATNKYECEIGLVLTKKTPIRGNLKLPLHITIDEYIKNETHKKDIDISIPIYCELKEKTIYIE